jgi:hypothetical protein
VVLTPDLPDKLDRRSLEVTQCNGHAESTEEGTVGVRQRSRSLLLSCAGIAFAMLALGSPAYAAPTAARTNTAGPSERAARISVLVAGVHLTAAQAKTLEAAANANPRMTSAQAAAVIGSSPATNAGHAIPDGHGTSKGPCGTASLFGYESGGFGYALFFNSTVGPPYAGSLTVSTNGVNASSDSFGIPPVSGSGIVDDTGVEGTGTTAKGWALTDNIWYCEISVFAEWP